MSERFTREDIVLFASAIDSHVYWQLSEEDERNNGFSLSESGDVKRAQEMQDRLENLAKALPTPFLLSLDGRMALALSRLVQLAANLMRQECDTAKVQPPKLVTEIAFADAVAVALRNNNPLPEVPPEVVPLIKQRRSKKEA